MSPDVALPFIAVCLGLQAFFSGTEMAMVNANRVALATRAEAGHRGAALAIALIDNEERLLGTCLIGTNLCVVTATTLVAMMLKSLGFESEALIALAYVPFALILGEALPKTVLHHHADTLAPLLAFPLTFVQTLFRPLLAGVSLWANALQRITGEAPRETLSRQDILELLEDPAIAPAEQRMIRGVFEMNETPVVDVMTPLIEVRAAATTDSVRDAIDAIIDSGHSRLPIFRDRIDNVVGVVHATDLLYGEGDVANLEQIMREVRYVPESKRVDELLGEMRTTPGHMAVIVDEYGGSVGLVTVEDLLEEIVGEIRDERDTENRSLVVIGPNRWRAPGRAELHEVGEELGVSFPDGPFETLAGVLLHRLGRIPQAGESLKLDQLVLTVEVATPRSVETVRIDKL